MCAKNRPLMPIIDSRLWLPASENGSTASAPCRSITACSRRAISASASSQRDLFELAGRPSGRRGAAGAGSGRGRTRGRGTG